MQIQGKSYDALPWNYLFQKPQKKDSTPEHGSTQLSPTNFDTPQSGGSFFENTGIDASRYTVGGDIWGTLLKSFADDTVSVHIDTRETDKSRTRQATNSDGTPIAVTQVSEGDSSQYRLQIGSDIVFDFSGDLRAGKNLDGNYLVYSPTTGKTIQYDTTGSVVEELDGDTTDTATNKIYIGTSGAEITGGEEDELFFILGDNTRINCGSGNDTVILATFSSGVQIDTGEGNNNIFGERIFDAEITTGNGDNRIEAKGFYDTKLSAGEGNNIVKAADLVGGSLRVGNGDNFIRFSQFAQATAIQMGNGNNQVEIYEFEKMATLEAGDGNNTVDVYGVGQTLRAAQREAFIFQNNVEDIGLEAPVDSCSLSFGNGNNHFTAYSLSYSDLKFGDGNNRSSVAVIEGSNFSVGDGNNKVHLGNMYGSSSGFLGGGNNYIRIVEAKDNVNISIGNGNNAINIGSAKDNSIFSIGHGSNDINISGISNNSLISLGNGDNIIGIYSVKDSSRIALGNGDNKLIISEADLPLNLSIGGGNNFICNFKNIFGAGSSLDSAEIESYKKMTEYFDAIRSERANSEYPSVLNMKNAFAEDTPQQVELMQRVAMLTRY